MVRKVESSIRPDHIIHSQHVQPRRNVILPALPECCDGLWARVNRICDQFMPQPGDVRLGSQMWWTPRENAQK
jgi:hypothetical protein